MEDKNEVNKISKKNNKTRKNEFDYKIIVIISIITILISFLSVFLYAKFFLKTEVIETTKLEKDVTVTDLGIADSVEKIYDAVVVVENYVNNSLYSTGTGFVYKVDEKNGYIITNYHVIENASEVFVMFTNNERIKTEIVGVDEYQDIALLSVSNDKVIKVASIGSSENLRVGDTTFAVGAPLDSSIYSWTVTRGILSGKNRLVEFSLGTGYFQTTTYVIEVLQTDTAINSGNSGGPLCNANGEVIGVTNMKIASESVEGMGFAIPIETIVEYADKFIKGEKITRPYLGISMYDIIISRNDKKMGIYIQDVEKGSSADKAGLETGDIITKINDIEVQSSIYLKYELYKHNIGDKITITYLRNNKEYTTEIILKGSQPTV